MRSRCWSPAYAIVTFSKAYTNQNEKDHAALARAVRSGKVKAVFEEER
jgi:hypothetical protein